LADEGFSLVHHFAAAGEDVDGLVFGEEADEVGEFGGDRLEMSGPGVGISRPGEPDAGLGFPFGGPAVAELGWGLVD
jgi:hypothetical protein